MTVNDVYSLPRNFLFTHWVLDIHRTAELGETCWWWSEAGASLNMVAESIRPLLSFVALNDL